MTKWFSFMDMHSGGGRKTKFEYYYVEAPTEEQARAIFTEKTGEDPDNVACPCCGQNFSVGGPYDTIEDAARYQVGGGFTVYEWLQNEANSPVQVIRLQSPADLTNENILL
jgi:hypothetical protein